MYTIRWLDGILDEKETQMFYVDRVIRFSVFWSYYGILLYTSTLKVKYILVYTDQISVIFVHCCLVVTQGSYR